MENKELEQVQEVAEVVETSNTMSTAMTIGGVVLGAAAVIGLGYWIVKKVRTRKMTTVESVECSESEPVEEVTEE